MNGSLLARLWHVASSCVPSQCFHSVSHTENPDTVNVRPCIDTPRLPLFGIDPKAEVVPMGSQLPTQAGQGSSDDLRAQSMRNFNRRYGCSVTMMPISVLSLRFQNTHRALFHRLPVLRAQHRPSPVRSQPCLDAASTSARKPSSLFTHRTCMAWQDMSGSLAPSQAGHTQAQPHEPVPGLLTPTPDSDSA